MLFSSSTTPTVVYIPMPVKLGKYPWPFYRESAVKPWESPFISPGLSFVMGNILWEVFENGNYCFLFHYFHFII